MLQSKKKLILRIAKNSVLVVSPRTPTFFQPKVEWEVIYFADYNSNGKVVSVWSKAWWQDGNFCTSKSSITTAGSFIIHHHSKGKESRSESWKSESLIRSLTPHSAVYFHICRESEIGINYTLFPLKKTIPLGLSKIIQQEFPLQGVNSTTMNISGLMGKQTTDKVSRRALFFLSLSPPWYCYACLCWERAHYVTLGTTRQRWIFPCTLEIKTTFMWQFNSRKGTSKWSFLAISQGHPSFPWCQKICSQKSDENDSIKGSLQRRTFLCVCSTTVVFSQTHLIFAWVSSSQY